MTWWWTFNATVGTFMWGFVDCQMNSPVPDLPYSTLKIAYFLKSIYFYALISQHQKQYRQRKAHESIVNERLDVVHHFGSVVLSNLHIFASLPVIVWNSDDVPATISCCADQGCASHCLQCNATCNAFREFCNGNGNGKFDNGNVNLKIWNF